ncbi:AraC family transcriptional regulator [Paludibacterium paludis]|uniref:Transcriptional regulator n=1 Tax=Paludibacterium paludis TaxID=1225769 RepID=A0A918UBB1_9NEIS|nr:helix-turn-helix transcriptional regulator [Paludibacterium paludis]GGY21049.1 transcriptional regulator [Paludibacterium paludis]
MSTENLLHPPQMERLPYPIHLRLARFPAGSRFVSHAHPWGQLNYSATGVMELDIGGRRFLSPPQYAIWIPPRVEHDAHIRQAVVYQSAYIDEAWCRDLPDAPKAIRIGSVVKAILADFALRDVSVPSTRADRRMARVLLDQIPLAPCSASYLPGSGDPLVSRLLDAWQRDPADSRTLARWADELHVTERTLARRCRVELGMSAGEWRQRQRYLHALTLLDAGLTVQNAALELGYGTASAFIAMFQRRGGVTPDQYRRDPEGVSRGT